MIKLCKLNEPCCKNSNIAMSWFGVTLMHSPSLNVIISLVSQALAYHQETAERSQTDLSTEQKPGVKVQDSTSIQTSKSAMIITGNCASHTLVGHDSIKTNTRFSFMVWVWSVFYLEVPALGLQPVIDKALRITGKTQHELPLGLQLIDGLNGLMNLKVMPSWRKRVKSQVLRGKKKRSK